MFVCESHECINNDGCGNCELDDVNVDEMGMCDKYIDTTYIDD